MNQERIMKVLLAPVISEKSTRIGDRDRQYVFKVMANASKPEIRNAVEVLFKVKVAGVRVANMRGKVKRSGRTFGCRPNWKKAYVSLQEGHEIEFDGTA
ncbi:MAG: 50S ribosomal protein L23 [Gammaproteobacteria bacterium]